MVFLNLGGLVNQQHISANFTRTSLPVQDLNTQKLLVAAPPGNWETFAVHHYPYGLGSIAIAITITENPIETEKWSGKKNTGSNLFRKLSAIACGSMPKITYKA